MSILLINNALKIKTIKYFQHKKINKKLVNYQFIPLNAPISLPKHSIMMFKNEVLRK